MSVLVLLIALVPAAGVVIVSEATNSRAAVALACVVAVLIGVMTGNPAYAALDVCAALAATWFSWPKLSPEEIQKKKKAKQEREAYYASQAYQDDLKRAESIGKSVVAFAAVAYFLWIFGLPKWGIFGDKQASSPAASTQTQTLVQPQPAVGYSSPIDRCKGSPQVQACEEEERRFLAETPEQASARRAALEASRTAAMKQVSRGAQQAGAWSTSPHQTTGTAPQKTMSYCLTLKDEAQMTRCMETAR